MVRVGIVGCGGIAQVHAKVLSSMANIALAACADIRPERAQTLAERYSLSAYSSLEDMLAHEQLDAVHICTPHSLHTPMVCELTSRGIAAFTEKPPVITRAQWNAFQQAASNAPVGVCFQNRYNANVRELKHILDEGGYGAFQGARAFMTWKRGAAYYTASGWRGAWDTEGGGALINQAVHTLDLFVWLLGKPDSVECTMRNHHLQGTIEVDDTCEAFLRYGDRPVLLYATTAYSMDAPLQVEFQFEQAVIRLENDCLDILRGGKTARREYQTLPALGKDYWGVSHTACIQDFYASLEEHRPFQNDAASVANTVAVLLEMYEQGRKTL